jgi:large subunit ribosomal protein L6
MLAAKFFVTFGEAMSRIGNKIIDLPKAVALSMQDGVVTGKSAQGQLTVRIPEGIAVKIHEGKVEVSVSGSAPRLNALQGTTRSLIANMVLGLETPFVKQLEIQGVGFRVQQQGQKLVLALGFSHPIEHVVPAGVTAKVTDGTAITLSGADKHLVGETAARIRGYFPAEPYKGKGVRYKGEHVRRKAGKAVA